MNYVEAPMMPQVIEKPLLFLAGGISDCPGWQAEVISQLAELGEGTILNPRRADWDPKGGEQLIEQQIRWEAQWLWTSDIVVFWFCKDTTCPITLYELGTQLARHYLGTDKKICIGIEPGYSRELDVKIQADLLARNVPIVHSLFELVEFIKTAHAQEVTNP